MHTILVQCKFLVTVSTSLNFFHTCAITKSSKAISGIGNSDCVMVTFLTLYIQVPNYLHSNVFKYNSLHVHATGQSTKYITTVYVNWSICYNSLIYGLFGAI